MLDTIRVVCSVICVVFLVAEARCAYRVDCPFVGHRLTLGAFGWLLTAMMHA